MATATRTKENGCDFPLFKTPMRTPIRSGMLSSATLNDLASYSGNKKHLKFVGTTSMNDLQMDNGTTTITPIRIGNNKKFATPGSIQRRALGLVNHNSHHNIPYPSISSDDIYTSATLKETNPIKIHQNEEPVVLVAPAPKSSTHIHPQDDLPHESGHCQEDTFDDLIPNDERIERMLTNHRFGNGGINIFTYDGGIENTIRCQSPICGRFNIATLLDMTDILN